MLWTAIQHHGPVMIRYPRGNGEGVPIKAHPAVLPIGKAEVLQHGTDVAVVFYGAVQKIARETVRALEAEGRSVALINARFCKPLDRDVIEKYGHIARVICTIEDHVLMGGFGSAVLEALDDLHLKTPLVRIGWPDKFIEHATTPADLQNKYGMNAATAVAKIRDALALAAQSDAGSGQKFRVLGAVNARTA
jgi:1-deoxy-D-xylulose-5-phosphate synthase